MFSLIPHPSGSNTKTRFKYNNHNIGLIIMAYKSFVDENDDGSKTYVMRKKVTIFDSDDLEEDSSDRIRIKRVKDYNHLKDFHYWNNSDFIDFVKKNTEETKEERLARIAVQCADARRTKKEKEELSDALETATTVIKDRYDREDLEGLKKELPSILFNPENTVKIMDVLMDIYKETKE